MLGLKVQAMHWSIYSFARHERAVYRLVDSSQNRDHGFQDYVVDGIPLSDDDEITGTRQAGSGTLSYTNFGSYTVVLCADLTLLEIHAPLT